jgi:hypothetical protein
VSSVDELRRRRRRVGEREGAREGRELGCGREKRGARLPFYRGWERDEGSAEVLHGDHEWLSVSSMESNREGEKTDAITPLTPKTNGRLRVRCRFAARPCPGVGGWLQARLGASLRRSVCARCAVGSDVGLARGLGRVRRRVGRCRGAGRGSSVLARGGLAREAWCAGWCLARSGLHGSRLGARDARGRHLGESKGEERELNGREEREGSV